MNRFSCDICDTNVNFEENTVLLSRGEKIADICPKCSMNIQGYIKDERNQFEDQETETVPEPNISIETAKAILEKAGFRFYKRKI